MSVRRARVTWSIAVLAAALLASLAGSAPAFANQPWWHITSTVAPSTLTVGKEGKIVVEAVNLGDAEVSGASKRVTITDKLPHGLKVTEARGEAGDGLGLPGSEGEFGVVTCPTVTSEEVQCQSEGVLPSYQGIRVEITVVAEETMTNAGDEATVAGGEPYVCRRTGSGRFVNGLCRTQGAGGEFEKALTGKVVAPASARGQITTGSAPMRLEVENYEMTAENEDGSVDTQAGSHPFQFTTTFGVDRRITPDPLFGVMLEEPVALARDLRFNLPAGLVGDVTDILKCSSRDFAQTFDFTNLCPADTAVGVASVTVVRAQEGDEELVHTVPVPVFNLAPAPGEPARFGFDALTVPVMIETSVRSGGDYGVVASVRNASEIGGLLGSTLTLWGVPADARHDQLRGWACIIEGLSTCEEEANTSAHRHPTPFLTLPTSCDGPLQTSVEFDTWKEAGSFETSPPTVLPTGLGGCDLVPFGASLGVELGASTPHTPTTLAAHLKVPQEASEDPTGLATAAVRNTKVVLPAGLQINPAAAGGLEACTEGEIGFERREADGQAVFNGETEQERRGEAPHSECPEGSRIGKVTVKTPLLSEPLTGYVYQAAENENPFGSLLALYVVAENKTAGVRVRLAGEVKVLSTGQLESSFADTPQLPFEEFTLELFGGSKAPLATSGCGAYRTEGSVEPWSGSQPVDLLSESLVNTGCVSSEPFAPTFVAGTTDNRAGSSGPLTVTASRKDEEQAFNAITITMPPGLIGMISKITPCGETQANAGQCPAASQIGHVVVQAGVGSEPVTLPESGRREDPVYLTGPYRGAPFGLAVVVHPEAGPFNLEEGGPVVVRAKIHVDPSTAQVSIASEPFPTRLRGIPLDVRNLEVIVDKQGFILNPTNCSEESFASSIEGTGGGAFSTSSRYQAADCANLPFKPGLDVTTQAHTSRVNGVSVRIKLTEKPGEADIRTVKLQFPLSLPARLTTLRKACTEVQFAASPAGCPTASDIGTATVKTPVLVAPLTGPAYIVSHGGAAFPDVEFLLQGEGVEVILDNKVDIKKGLAHTEAAAVPDVPFSSFEATLPAGPHSILAGIGNLCHKHLIMPAEITGQNGAAIKQNTTIAVEGCPSALSIVSRSVKQHTLYLKVYVPAAGTIRGFGRALTPVSEVAKGSEVLTLALRATEAGRLSTTARLSFAPLRGRKQAEAVTVEFRR